jgi:hypothetical protein
MITLSHIRVIPYKILKHSHKLKYLCLWQLQTKSNIQVVMRS